MTDTIFIPTPITQKPDKDGYYIVINPTEEDSGRALYFMEGDWFENEWEARVDENHDAVDVDDCVWLRPASLSDIISDAWDAATMTCMESGGPADDFLYTKESYINSITNPSINKP